MKLPRILELFVIYTGKYINFKMPISRKQIAHLNNINLIRHQEKIQQTKPDGSNTTSEDANVAVKEKPDNPINEPENPSRLRLSKIPLLYQKASI